MRTIFINLSNHPSDKWSKKQLEAVKELTNNESIVDIPFPQIDPEMPSEDVVTLAKEYFYKNILNVIYDVESTDDVPDKIYLHIMGEMCFTYNVVELAKFFSKRELENITCIASTTKRNVVEKEDGTKISIFEFVQFREY